MTRTACLEELPTPRLDETLIMAAVAGCVDGLGFLLLSGLFAANMTGNSVKFGLYVARSRWDLALASGATVPLFVLGVLIGALLRTYALQHGRPARALILGLEAVLIAAFTFIAARVPAERLAPEHGVAFWALALLALLSMGLQSALKPHVGGLFVRMTFITGTVVSLAEAAVEALLEPEAPTRRAARRRVVLFAAIWVCYTAGAMIGALLEQHYGPRAMLLPLCGLILLVAREAFGPRRHRVDEKTGGKDPAPPGAEGATWSPSTGG